jgi:hypothetical protein
MFDGCMLCLLVYFKTLIPLELHGMELGSVRLPNAGTGHEYLPIMAHPQN